MSELNGHGGYHENGSGGTGALHSDLEGGFRQKSTAKMYERAIRKGWITPENAPKDIPEVVYKAMIKAGELGNDRTVATMAEILRRMEADNLTRLQVLDKISRLDEGSATENISHTTISLEFDDRS